MKIAESVLLTGIVLIRNGIPGHGSIVLIEAGTISIQTDVDDLQPLVIGLHGFVELYQRGGESSARRAPMGGEV